MIPPINFDNPVKSSSDKVYHVNLNVKEQKGLTLPSKSYGPICLKILHQFIEHHNLSKDLPMPVPGLSPHESLGRIFDIILCSMGPQKREEMIKECQAYSDSIL